MNSKIKKFITYGAIVVIGVVGGNFALLSYGVDGFVRGIAAETEDL